MQRIHIRDRAHARPVRRFALTAVALGLAVAAPAAAARADTTRDTRPAAPAHSAGAVHGDHTTGAATPQAGTTIRSGDPQSTVGHVADFYGTYIDVAWDARNDDLRNDLRQHFLTSGLRTKLASWEAAQHADGVLRAQDTPTGWQVTADGSGAGHAFSVVRLTWGSAAHPDYTYLKVQSDLATQQISDIEEQ
ncbi:hypothetical protein SAMN05216223_102211 [Actinacidiphila yanglinensis]|uniref:Secreted protein n=1 Tax=Actinacidiphila yanglinensis TaxID=310779 RepID=A0A1H5VA00_9ACTN|nr:hypothetical protein [Actinacidiphila yanglinensis]SEF84040.1 hypothetical protein SAMN05216223_102211 [Actinacidiphila yanglinensis]